MTNILFTSLAYKAVVLQLMVAEANFYAERLKLPESRPIQMTHLTGSHIGAPEAGFGLGSFQTKNYSYSFPGNGKFMQLTNDGRIIHFPEKGKLAYIAKRDPFKAFGGSLFDQKLINARSLIDTNDAYQMATQWLTAISIDVAALEKKHKPLVVQQSFYDPPISPAQYDNIPKDAPRKTRPVFDVTWGGTIDNALVWMQILGPTKELTLLRMEDTTFSRRPAIVVTNALELNHRPDPQVKKLQTLTNRTAKSIPTVSSNVLSTVPESLPSKVVP